MADQIPALLAAAGYPYPGSPAAAIAMLLDELAAAMDPRPKRRHDLEYMAAGYLSALVGRDATVHVLTDGQGVVTGEVRFLYFGEWFTVTPALIPREPERTCRGCGCTEAKACLGGCSWVAKDLCSACDEGRAAPVNGACAICGDLDDHGGRPHSEATGDGRTRAGVTDG